MSVQNFSHPEHRHPNERALPQVDFAQPKRFGLTYKTRDNSDATPLCIHRAPLGTHERFIGFLIEHYAGDFPLWLSLEQVRVLPIGDDPALFDYARAIQTELRASRVRCELDPSSDHIKAKIANRADESAHHARKSETATWKPTPSASACTARETSVGNRAQKRSRNC